MRSAGDRASVAVARHRSELSRSVLTEVGGGLDNTVFRLGDLAVRVGDRAGVGREVDVLGVLGRHDLGVAVPVPAFVDEAEGVIGYAWIPGTPLLGREAPIGLAVAVGAVLGRLHAIDPAEVPALPHEGDDLAEWLDDLTGPDELLAVVRQTVPATGPQRVLVHNDLGAEHLLEAGGALAGVIDWTDAAVSDPAVDFARIFRDFGPAFLDRALAAYGGHPDSGFRDRVLFLARCAALKDLAYGAQPGREAYRSAASASLGWLFPQLVPRGDRTGR